MPRPLGYANGTAGQLISGTTVAMVNFRMQQTEPQLGW
jgi:hypothetical protein